MPDLRKMLYLFVYSDYKEYHTDRTVHFVVTMQPDKLLELEKDGLHKAFKLQTTVSTTSLVCIFISIVFYP